MKESDRPYLAQKRKTAVEAAVGLKKQERSSRGNSSFSTVALFALRCKSYLIRQRTYARRIRREDDQADQGIANDDMQHISQLTFQPSRGGGRIASPALRQSLAYCADFAGLEADVDRYELLLLVKRVTDQAALREEHPVLKPAAYFRGMVNKARRGELRLHNSIFGLLSRGETGEPS